MAINESLAQELGLDIEQLQSDNAAQILSGNQLQIDANPIALAYAGHQFGHLTPQLGDGRAILLGEIITPNQQIFDVQLKGAGPTFFSRGGDGRSALGPVLREFLCSEAMHALGVPTARSLAAVLTGDYVYRTHALPGAILTRIAQSHLRIGTFQYFAYKEDTQALQELTEYAIQRHHIKITPYTPQAITLLEYVIQQQAQCIAHWMSIGFIHGVMNTDNMTISGETIDYGPCAFMDKFSYTRVLSSIDIHGRYQFNNQADIAQWNLARFAESLMPMFFKDKEKIRDVMITQLKTFNTLFHQYYIQNMQKKLGLLIPQEKDENIIELLLNILNQHHIDYTLFFNYLTKTNHPSAIQKEPIIQDLFADKITFLEWYKTYQHRLSQEQTTAIERYEIMRQKNPIYIPRHYLLEQAIQNAEQGDNALFFRLKRVLSKPFQEHPKDFDLSIPPGQEQWQYKTFCGT